MRQLSSPSRDVTRQVSQVPEPAVSVNQVLALLEVYSPLALGRGKGSTKFTLNVLPREGQFSPAFTFQVTSTPN